MPTGGEKQDQERDPDLVDGGWPLGMLAEDVQAVVTHLDLDPVILVGHSMGGPVAVQAAKLLGDRVAHDDQREVACRRVPDDLLLRLAVRQRNAHLGGAELGQAFRDECKGDDVRRRSSRCTTR